MVAELLEDCTPLVLLERLFDWSEESAVVVVPSVVVTKIVNRIMLTLSL